MARMKIKVTTGAREINALKSRTNIFSCEFITTSISRLLECYCEFQILSNRLVSPPYLIDRTPAQVKRFSGDPAAPPDLVFSFDLAVFLNRNKWSNHDKDAIEIDKYLTPGVQQ